MDVDADGGEASSLSPSSPWTPSHGVSDDEFSAAEGEERYDYSDDQAPGDEDIEPAPFAHLVNEEIARGLGLISHAQQFRLHGWTPSPPRTNSDFQNLDSLFTDPHLSDMSDMSDIEVDDDFGLGSSSVDEQSGDLDSPLDQEEGFDSWESPMGSEHDSPSLSGLHDEEFDHALLQELDDNMRFLDGLEPPHLGHTSPFLPIERLMDRFQSEVQGLTESVREFRQRVGAGSGSSVGPGNGAGSGIATGGGDGSGEGQDSRGRESSGADTIRGSASVQRSRGSTAQRSSPFHPGFTRHSRAFHPYSRDRHLAAAGASERRNSPQTLPGLSNLNLPLPQTSTERNFVPPHASRQRIFAPSEIARARDLINRHPTERMADHLHEIVVERRRLGAGRQQSAPQAPPAFIDLTNSDDDEPEAIPMPPPPNRGNPRRRSQIRRTPSLARSDGSLLGGAAPVIDLTGDDLPMPQLPRTNSNNGNSQGANRRNRPPRFFGLDPQNQIDLSLDDDEENNEGDDLHTSELRPGGAFFDILRNLGSSTDSRFFIGGGIDFIHRLGGQVFGNQPAEVDVQFIGRMDNPVANPLANNIPDLNYGTNGYNNPVANDKPPYIPPPPAEPGFTRNTGGDEVVICPSCEEHLAYDPNEEPEHRPASKKARTKKDQAVHHFWAIKECGHVFCRSCYDNRMKTDKTAFRPVEGTAAPRKQVLCAVENCPSVVNNKSAWVGLFV